MSYLFSVNAVITALIIQVTIFLGMLIAPKQALKPLNLNLESVLYFCCFFSAFINGTFQEIPFGSAENWIKTAF